MFNTLRIFFLCIGLFGISEPAAAQQKFLKFTGQPQDSERCYYQENAPTSIEVSVLLDGDSSSGLIQFFWPKTDRKGPESSVALLNVTTRKPKTLDGAYFDAPLDQSLGLQIKFASFIDSRSGGYVVNEIIQNSGDRKWRCLGIPLKRVSPEKLDESDVKRFVAVAEQVRSGEVVAAQNEGPSEPEVRDQMTSAAANNLCNPTDPEMAAQIQAFNASGLGAYKVEGAACVAYMMGFPVGTMRFNQESWSCDVNSKSKIATCVSEMTLRCETPTDTTGLSASYCSSVLSANFIFSGKSDFNFNSQSGSWVAGPVSVAGKER